MKVSNCQRYRATKSLLTRRASVVAALRRQRSSLTKKRKRRVINKVSKRKKSLIAVIQGAVSVRYPLRRAPLTRRNLSVLKMRWIVTWTTRVAAKRWTTIQKMRVLLTVQAIWERVKIATKATNMAASLNMIRNTRRTIRGISVSSSWWICFKRSLGGSIGWSTRSSPSMGGSRVAW